MLLSPINPSLVSTQGTAIGAAINLAVRSFTPNENSDKAIILITDGENHEGDAIQAAKAAADKGIHVNIVGIGDPKGAPIPVGGRTNYMKAREGNVVITKLNETMCHEIAAAGNGTYVRADNTNSSLRALQDAIEKINKTALATDKTVTKAIIAFALIFEGIIFLFWFFNSLAIRQSILHVLVMFYTFFTVRVPWALCSFLNTFCFFIHTLPFVFGFFRW